MQASIQKKENHYLARFERKLKHPVRDVWAMLTDNDRLAFWFDELRADELRKGGAMTFDMGDGTFERMEITDYEPQSVLEYEWGEDRVRFSLHPESEGCLLVLEETVNRITDHTAKDLAGWHVCLEAVETILDGGKPDDREELWRHWHEKYTAALESSK